MVADIVRVPFEVISSHVLELLIGKGQELSPTLVLEHFFSDTVCIAALVEFYLQLPS